MVRLRTGFCINGGEPVQLRGLIASYLDEGVDGVALGFLNSHAGIDLEVHNTFVTDGDFTWAFHRAADSCLGFNDAWEDLATLPRLDQVLTAGPARGVEHGLDELLKRARSNLGVT